ncbi:LysR family transcriptional regulator [Paraglaciecola sp. 2405UD69-4]|uniref:LysR family transcriptional regulator n=1 Tax=Paraglaciecola sp. 2405UD69-4 TaxID=3391836 RepID=UPI0039C9FB56
MDIRFLETFLEVSETRHFGKAAENLYLTQSAVSARIKQLEEYFNSALFVRNRNSLQLTSAGEKLLPYATELAETLKQTRLAMNEESIQYLSIACTSNAWELYLKQQLQHLNTALQAVSIRAEIFNNEQLSRMVHEHSVDLAITTLPFKSDDVETLELNESVLSIYQSTVGTSLDDQIQSIAFDWGRKVNEAIDKAYPEFRKAELRTGSLQVAMQYLASHTCQLALPHDIAEPLVQKGELKKVASLAPTSVKCYLIYLKETKNAWLNDFVKTFKA